jgi:hypothetical protein
MKKTGSIVIAVALAAFLSACGGGGGSSTTGTTTPTATSAKSMAVNSELLNFGTQMWSVIPTALPSGMVTKTTIGDATVSCTGTLSGYSCTLTDTQGGTCTATGSFTGSGNTVFTAITTCDNFHPDSYTLVDGSLEIDININMDNAPAETSAITVAKNLAKETNAGECLIGDDDTTWGENDMCQLTETECTAANSFFTFNYVIGSDGLTITDPCGTFVYSPGLTMSAYMCALTQTTFNFTFDLNGTFNGQPVDMTETFTCNFTL